MDPYPGCPSHSADEMVYTKARLEHALRAFRETSSYLRKKGLPSENLERHLRSKYAFRKSSKVAPLTNVTLWQDRSNGGSDDEEYDPAQEKKRLNAKRKKKVETKRKAEDTSDEERSTKKVKGEEVDGVYIGFVLTSDKGKQLLRDLSRVHKTDLASFEKERSEEVEPTYWKRYASSNGNARRESGVDMLKHDDSTGSMDLERPNGSSHGPTTSLRSGKILEKPKGRKKENQTTNDMLRQDKDVASDLKAKPLHLSAHQNQAPPKLGANSRSVKQIFSSSQPVELQDDSDEEAGQPTGGHYPVDGKHGVNKNHNTSIKHEYPSPPLSRSEEFSFTQAASLLDQPGLITIETAYAHPIDFRYMPPIGQKCDFCADWRVGVLGHGKRLIQVFIDPEHPTQFQEMGNGHRSLGKPCTKMCISCALDRLLIMRCHCAEQDDGCNGSVSTQTAPVFSRVQGYNRANLELYGKALFARPGTAEAIVPPSKNGPLPACNLCPAPAAWQCSKWQKADKMKKPCRVPNVAGNAASAAISLSSSLLTPPSTPTNVSGATSGNGHKRKPSIITLSDSDDDFPPSKPSTTITHAPQSSSSSHRAPSTLSSNGSQQSQSQAALRAPIKGCGLKLCVACKAFMETKCNGKLEKRKVMSWWRGESRYEARADLEWLFQGSCLERTYEEGVRR